MPVLKAKDVEAALRKGGPASVAADVPARFTPGDRVVVRNINPFGHTRAPRYIRCRRRQHSCPKTPRSAYLYCVYCLTLNEKQYTLSG